MGGNVTFPDEGASFREEQGLIKINLENNIKTDTDLVIQDTHLHCPGQKFTFHNSASNLINITITNTTIKETYLEFNGDNISLYVEDSVIQIPQMSFRRLSQPVVISNCIFTEGISVWMKNYIILVLRYVTGAFLLVEKAIVAFYNCNITGMKDGDLPNTFIYCDQSSITMMNVTVTDNAKRLMSARYCDVRITHSKFKNNLDLHLHFRSIFNSTFTGFISNCVFSNNSGSVIDTYRGKIRIEHSHFLNNDVDHIGTIAVYTKSQVCMINSTFIGSHGASLNVREESNMITEQCSFLQNKARGRGGVINIHQSKYSDNDSIFANNVAEIAGKVQTQKNIMFSVVTLRERIKC